MMPRNDGKTRLGGRESIGRLSRLWCRRFAGPGNANRAYAPPTVILILVLLGWIVINGVAEAAAPFQTIDAFQQNKLLGRGVNILGWDPIWQDRAKARFKEWHFVLIGHAGFNNVRIVLQPFKYGKLDRDYRISPEWFSTVDWAINTARKNNLVVILDLHEYLEMGEKPAANKEKFLAMWQQIADHYHQAPNDVLFEILNEPNTSLTPDLWNEYLAEALIIIRKTNPTRNVIVGPGLWNAIDALPQLQLPDADRHLIVTVHYYSPFTFTHQGAAWANLAGKTGIRWSGSVQERQAVARDLQKAQTWATKHGRPIFLGEFGTYEKADMASRARWTDCVARTAEGFGWSWAYWQFDNDFIVYDITRARWIAPILDALVPRSWFPQR